MPKVILLCEGILVRMEEITDGWQVCDLASGGYGLQEKKTLLPKMKKGRSVCLSPDK